MRIFYIFFEKNNVGDGSGEDGIKIKDIKKKK